MPLLILVAIVALPFLEIWSAILVGQQIGALWTVAALAAASVAGIMVMRWSGLRVIRDIDATARTGEMPRRGMLDPVMLLVGGMLLAFPGFVSGALGLLLVLPFTRPALRWVFAAWARRRFERMQARMDAAATGAPPGVVVVDGEVVRRDPEAQASSDAADESRPTVIRGEIVDGKPPHGGGPTGPTA
ncbi:FxsA family protein [Lipingzhangella sp. LS1_29]|uniref:FxsA family protein n=1 Tax=Lipingzhangella rawalii TaxID=2055835 RepID=A0ABU2H0Y8_9ACTN|nr:FxsA family protein [Lipingzhangella rawalii]MDS1268971.1 FxsA family protein [Lipingzhangella rawalii]